MFVLPLSAVERGSLIIIIALVLTLEMINATFEQFIDYFHPHFSDHVKQIKDTLAGMVFRSESLIIIIALVLTLEMINATFEQFIDYFHPHFSDHVKQIKDTLAGMVF